MSEASEQGVAVGAVGAVGAASFGAYEDPRAFLKRHSLRPKDSFGQCFLIAPPVAQSIVAALDPRDTESVLEIGTGCGTLAKMVAPRARRVVALERDRDLVRALATETLPANVEVLETDAGAFDYAAFCAAEPSVIVGNLPYQLTGRLLRAMLAPPVRWRRAVVMVQKEVAARLLAKPGDDDWGALSVFTRAACAVKKVTDASPGCFHPAPRVVSTVVALEPHAVPVAEETDAFRAVVHALFAARRKTTQNGLAALPNVGRDKALAACVEAGVDPKLRPEVLPIEQLAGLAKALYPAK